jgi:hypothetical protein
MVEFWFLIALGVGLPVAFIAIAYFWIGRKWRASVAYTPAEQRKAREIAAAHFGDPLAGQIDWTPMQFGGARKRTYELVRMGSQRMEFRTIMEPKAKQSLLVMLVGPPLFLGFWVVYGRADLAKDVFPIFLLVFGGMAALVLLAFYYNRQRTFDMGLRQYWSTWLRPASCPGISPSSRSPKKRRRYPKCLRIRDIHALQIVSERVVQQKERKGLLGGYQKPPPDMFMSYELNLVLEDGTRVSVLDHGDLDGLRSDAGEVSSFIGVPLWDSTVEAPDGTLGESGPGREGQRGPYHGSILFLLDQSRQAAGKAAEPGADRADGCREALSWLEKLLMSHQALTAGLDPETFLPMLQESVDHLHASRPAEAEKLLLSIRPRIEEGATRE